jgi:hypothetical protein
MKLILERAVRIGRLTTPSQIATEIGRIYRHARRGELKTPEALRLATILSHMRPFMEASVLEARMEKFEADIAELAQSNVVPFGKRRSA